MQGRMSTTGRTSPAVRHHDHGCQNALNELPEPCSSLLLGGDPNRVVQYRNRLAFPSTHCQDALDQAAQRQAESYMLGERHGGSSTTITTCSAKHHIASGGWLFSLASFQAVYRAPTGTRPKSRSGLRLLQSLQTCLALPPAMSPPVASRSVSGRRGEITNTNRNLRQPSLDRSSFDTQRLAGRRSLVHEPQRLAQTTSDSTAQELVRHLEPNGPALGRICI